MTLYELAEQARELYALLEAGEIDEQTFNNTIEAIGTDDKTDSYCKIIRQLQADVESLKNEIDRLTAKKRAAENAVDRMKTALLDFAKVCGGKTRTELFSVTVKSSQKTSIFDPDAIPEAYKVPQPDKISTAEIGKALKAGETIPGARLEKSEYIQIK